MSKGLEIAQTFFREWGLTYIQQNFPHLEKRVMAGLFHGSQIYGADDELSQDHGWGPMFTLFLSEKDYTTYGEELSRRVRLDAPREWQGFHFHFPDENIDVTSLERFFKDELGYDDPDAWQKMEDRTYNRDLALYRIRHGHVLYDPAGEFARWRAAFHTYPRHIWLARVEQELFHVWHYGQYNFLDRLTHRRDPVVIQIAMGHFTEAVMRLCLLLEHDYGPYWKWLAFEFRKRASAERLDPLLRALAETLDIAARASLVRTICDEVHQLLDQSGLSREHLGWDGWHPHPLMCDIQALKGYIQREEDNACSM